MAAFWAHQKCSGSRSAAKIAALPLICGPIGDRRLHLEDQSIQSPVALARALRAGEKQQTLPVRGAASLDQLTAKHCGCEIERGEVRDSVLRVGTSCRLTE